MHRRRVMYNGVYTHYPSFPYRHHGVNLYSSYDILEPLPISNVNICVPPYYHDYGYRRGISYIDYPYYDYIPRILPQPISLPPIVQTNVQNDIYYHFDDPDIYEDDYGNAYRLSRSKVQLVDIVPKNNVRTNPNDMVVSTYQPEEVPERIIIPRSNVVRHASFPPYARPKPTGVVPLYHSANSQYVKSKPVRVQPLYHSANPQYSARSRR